MNLIETIGKIVEVGGIGEENRQEVTADLKNAILFQTIDGLSQEEKNRLAIELQARTPEDVYNELSQSSAYAESFKKATDLVLADWLAEVMPEDQEAQQEILNKIGTM